MYFYEKPLAELTNEEWERICMKCGKCCLCKYSEDDVVHFSNYICKFFNRKEGLCSCYKTRIEKTNHECRKVDMELLKNDRALLPPSCAYRCLYEGRPLPPYHPLITGDSRSVLKANKTVQSLPVYPENILQIAFLHLLELAKRKNWGDERIKKEVEKIREKYKLKWLETYSLPTN